jgi:hypothetical protein
MGAERVWAAKAAWRNEGPIGQQEYLILLSESQAKFFLVQLRILPTSLG